MTARIRGFSAFPGASPRIINSLCDRLLLYGFLEELHEFGAEEVQIVVNEMEQDAHHSAPEMRIEQGGRTTPIPATWSITEQTRLSLRR